MGVVREASYSPRAWRRLIVVREDVEGLWRGDDQPEVLRAGCDSSLVGV